MLLALLHQPKQQLQLTLSVTSANNDGSDEFEVGKSLFLAARAKEFFTHHLRSNEADTVIVQIPEGHCLYTAPALPSQSNVGDLKRRPGSRMQMAPSLPFLKSRSFRTNREEHSSPARHATRNLEEHIRQAIYHRPSMVINYAVYTTTALDHGPVSRLCLTLRQMSKGGHRTFHILVGVELNNS